MLAVRALSSAVVRQWRAAAWMCDWWTLNACLGEVGDVMPATEQLELRETVWEVGSKNERAARRQSAGYEWWI